MSKSTLYSSVIVIVVVAVVMLRRMQPRPVRPLRLAMMAAIFVLLLLFSLYSGRGNSLLHDVPALIATPFLLAAGVVVGWILVRNMQFWTDTQTGVLWMRGGIVFALIYLLTLALRLGSQYISQDPALTEHYSWLPGVSAALVFFSIGLWITRAVMVFLRYRQHLAEGGVPANLTPPVRPT